ncbi:MAG: hypothetical protein ACTHMI_02565 [Mucilaginibacter sp.]
MRDVRTGDELKKELQDLYILTRHWSADLGFLEEELQFFKNILHKYNSSLVNRQLPQDIIFEQKVFELEDDLASIRARIPAFLSLLAPFVENLEKPVDVVFLEKYNILRTELHSLFTAVRMTKKEIFAHIESFVFREKQKTDE